MTSYLADTHALIWFLAAQVELGRKALRAFKGLGTDSRIHVCTVSLWETAFLYDEGRLRLPQGFSAWCDALEGLPGLQIEPLLRADIEEARTLRLLKDPFDRLIAGTALRLGVPLLTRDARMASIRRLKVVW